MNITPPNTPTSTPTSIQNTNTTPDRYYFNIKTTFHKDHEKSIRFAEEIHDRYCKERGYF